MASSPSATGWSYTFLATFGCVHNLKKLQGTLSHRKQERKVDTTGRPKGSCRPLEDHQSCGEVHGFGLLHTRTN